MSPALARVMREEIEQTNRLSGATVHFSPERHLPASLVETIVQARSKEESERDGPGRGVGV